MTPSTKVEAERVAAAEALPTECPRWTRPSPTGGTLIGDRLAAVSRLSTALSGAELCAARTPLSTLQLQRSMVLARWP
jgi:hypothetical protein